MAMPRESTFLPTIKCSQCGCQVEISMMGDHLCSGPTAERKLRSLLPFALTPEYGNIGSPLSLPILQYHRPQSHKNSSTTYNNLRNMDDYRLLSIQAQPVRDPSFTYPFVIFPTVTHAGKLDRPYMQPGPLTPLSHPGDSPYNHQANDRLTPGEDFYPPGASLDNSVSSPRNIRRPGGYGGFGEQESARSGPSPSPSTPGLMERMNSMVAGPFDSSQRPSTSGMSAPMQTSTLQEPFQPSERPSTSHSNLSTGSGDGAFGSKVSRKNGYGGFGPPPSRSGDELAPPPLTPLSRSETFPRPSFSHEQPPPRTPSAPGTRPEHRRQKSSYSYRQGPDTSRPPPPRKSLIRPPTAAETTVDLAAEFGVGNPYHTPSDSASSGYSSFSQPSNPSTHTSPARSAAQRQHSESHMEDLMEEVESSMGRLSAKEGLSIPAQQQQQQHPRALSPTMAYSPSRVSPKSESISMRGPSPTQLDPFSSSPQLSASPQMGGQGEYFGRQEGPSPTEFPGRLEPSPLADRAGAPLPVRKDSALPYRGDCKACGLPIHGKSVSSADGRLTGKYHKPCFVCTTCSEPFASAEFYVLGDRPYCERHYHQLNGSLCGGCGRGIEGQYVEDETAIKYHVGCFCCPDCGRSLSEGYFEVDGRSYCEQDAHRRAHAQQNFNCYGPPGGMIPEHDPYAYQGSPVPQGPPQGYQQGYPHGHPQGHPQGPPRGRPMPPRAPNGLPRGPAPGGPGPRPGPGGPGPQGRGGRGGPRPPYGMPPNGMRPGMRPGPGPRMPPPGANGGPMPRMNKRMTRIGQM